jgi:hypothetical protein
MVCLLLSHQANPDLQFAKPASLARSNAKLTYGFDNTIYKLMSMGSIPSTSPLALATFNDGASSSWLGRERDS